VISPQEQRYSIAVQALLASRKFLTWQTADGQARYFPTPLHRLASEKHFTPAEVSKLWGISSDLVRDVFRNEPGVLLIGNKTTKIRRGYKTMRIPESVLLAVHTKLSAKPAKVG